MTTHSRHALDMIERPNSHLSLQAPRAAWGWREDAACKDVENPDIFFPETPEEARQAKELCSICPVIRQCDEFARGMRIRSGIWAGKNREARA